MCFNFFDGKIQLFRKLLNGTVRASALKKIQRIKVDLYRNGIENGQIFSYELIFDVSERLVRYFVGNRNKKPFS